MERIRAVFTRFASRRRKGGLDLIVVFGVFAASAILVMGLFPHDGGSEGRLMYLYTMMSVPIIIGVYFIIISFRRSVVRDVSERESSIRTKIMLMFVFVAVLPVIPVVIVSNTMMNRLVDQITAVDPGSALSRAIDMTRDEMIADADGMRTDCTWLRYALDNGILSAGDFSSRQHITHMMAAKGYVFQSFRILGSDGMRTDLAQLPGDAGETRFTAGMRSFLSLAGSSTETYVSRVTIDSTPILAGAVTSGGVILVVYREVSDERLARLASFENTAQLYNRKIESRPFMRSVTGLLMLILAIGVVLVSIILSLYLSRTITRPILQIEKAARDVASGDLSVSLFRGKAMNSRRCSDRSTRWSGSCGRIATRSMWRRNSTHGKR